MPQVGASGGRRGGFLFFLRECWSHQYTLKEPRVDGEKLGSHQAFHGILEGGGQELGYDGLFLEPQ
jgi:hypothetical protein